MENSKRIKLAKRCLQGISIGDAFGESFFGDTDTMLNHISESTIPPTSWEFTDDTVMSMAVFEELEMSGTINQDSLAKKFARNHQLDPNRGYGATARTILRSISEGQSWEKLSREVFEGMGSMGNGASMRVGPIGAYFYDDLESVKALATKSALITHSNIEAVCGAVAVAIATAIATKSKLDSLSINPSQFILEILEYLPDCDTKSKIAKSVTIPYSYHIETVKSILGNGSKIMAKDTVPFSIWCAVNNLEDFEASLWKAVSILGDRDTICAIVAGISIMSADEKSIPLLWEKEVESFETSAFRTLVD